MSATLSTQRLRAQLQTDDGEEQRVRRSVVPLFLNVDEAASTAAQFGIKSIPTVIVFKNGKVVEQIVGVQSKDTFKKLIDQHV